jgi:hypothetical protein
MNSQLNGSFRGKILIDEKDLYPDNYQQIRMPVEGALKPNRKSIIEKRRVRQSSSVYNSE